jgi:hypothetical protein
MTGVAPLHSERAWQMNCPREPSAIESAWNILRTHLENERRRIHQEIRSYPRPIPACDQQFNYLLEERSKIYLELTRLHEAFEEGQNSGEPVKFLDVFIRSSSYLDDATKQKLGCCLNERIPGFRMDIERAK